MIIFCFIFIVSKPAIHCEWGDWVIGQCSVSCGTGTRTNIRTKIVQEENGGACNGGTTEIEACNTQECPGTLLYIIYSYFLFPFYIYHKI